MNRNGSPWTDPAGRRHDPGHTDEGDYYRKDSHPQDAEARGIDASDAPSSYQGGALDGPRSSRHPDLYASAHEQGSHAGPYTVPQGGHPRPRGPSYGREAAPGEDRRPPTRPQPVQQQQGGAGQASVGAGPGDPLQVSGIAGERGAQNASPHETPADTSKPAAQRSPAPPLPPAPRRDTSSPDPRR